MTMSDRELDRTVREWLVEGATAFPDRALDAVLDEVPRTGQRHRRFGLPVGGAQPARRLLMAAVVTVAVVGGLYAAGRTIGNWIPGPGEWRTFPAVEGELEPGRYVIGDPFPIRIGLTVPAGWDAVPGGATQALIGTEAAALTFTVVEGVFANPCHLEEGLISPPVGPGADDLAIALAGLPGMTTTGPSETTVDGFRAYAVTLGAPSDMSACTGDPPLFRIWGVPGGHWLEPGERNSLWIVEVGAQRIVISAEELVEATPETRAALDGIVASIDIEPDVSVEPVPGPSAAEVARLPDAGSVVPGRRYGFPLRLFERGTEGGAVPLGQPNRISLDGGDGWFASGGDGVERRGPDGSPVVRVAASTVGRIYIDPCHWRTSPLGTVDPGDLGTLETLANAFWAHWGPDPALGDGYNVPSGAPRATEPIDHPQYGKYAKKVELTVPGDLDIATCDGGQYRIWDDGKGRHRTANGPGETIQLWIVDVDPGLAVIDASSMPDATDGDLAALDEFLPTVWIDPPSPTVP